MINVIAVSFDPGGEITDPKFSSAPWTKMVQINWRWKDSLKWACKVSSLFFILINLLLKSHEPHEIPLTYNGKRVNETKTSESCERDGIFGKLGTINRGWPIPAVTFWHGLWPVCTLSRVGRHLGNNEMVSFLLFNGGCTAQPWSYCTKGLVQLPYWLLSLPPQGPDGERWGECTVCLT